MPVTNLPAKENRPASILSFAMDRSCLRYYFAGADWLHSSDLKRVGASMLQLSLLLHV